MPLQQTGGIYFCEPHYLQSHLDRLYNATEEDVEAARAQFGDMDMDDDGDDDCAGIYDEDGDEANISISGVLSQDGPSWLMRLFGMAGTGYKNILAAITRAESNPMVKRMNFRFNSPGGEMVGCDEVWQAINACEKPTMAINHGLMASAAYYIGSACNQVMASAPNNETGSIGAYFAGIDDTEALAQNGMKRVKIISADSPRKDSGVDSKDGRTELQLRANAQCRQFIARVAEGRGTTYEDVLENFGNGAVLVAMDVDASKPDAISVGMIDGLVTQESKPAPSDASSSAHVSMRDLFPMGLQIRASASGKADYPILDRPWDATAANDRWRKFTGSAKEPSASYKDGHFWYDQGKPKDFGSYKLEFVDVVNGKVYAIRKAIFACDGAMHGARGKGVDIPAKDRQAVQSKIDAYKKRIADEDKKNKSKSAALAAGGSMDLATLLAANQGAKEEYLAHLDQARADGIASIQKRIDSARPYLSLANSEKGYTEQQTKKIAEFAIQVIAGEKNADVLESFVALLDTQIEGSLGSAAASEQAAQGETPSSPSVDLTLQEAVLKLGQKRVDAIKAYCDKNKVDLLASLRAEIEYQPAGGR